MGWTCSEPLRRGLAGRCMLQRRPGKSTTLLFIVCKCEVPSRHVIPSHLSNAKTCRITLPIGTQADRRSPYSFQQHAHARVCSALTYSVLQCPGVMPACRALVWIGIWAHLVACTSRDETSHGPAMDYGLWVIFTSTDTLAWYTVAVYA